MFAPVIFGWERLGALFETAFIPFFLIIVMVVISGNRGWDFIMQSVLLVFLAVRVLQSSGCYCERSNGPLSALGHLSSLSAFNEFRAVNEKLFRSGLKERGSYFPTSKYIFFFCFFIFESSCCTGFDAQFVFSQSFSFCTLRRDGRAAAALVLLQTRHVDSVKLKGVPVS